MEDFEGDDASGSFEEFEEDQEKRTYSQAFGSPPQISAGGSTNNIAPMFPAIRAASTPTAMPDRIPPGVDTPIQVNLPRRLAARTPITLSVHSASNQGGSATINSRDSLNLTNSATVRVRGMVQTSPGEAGNLRIIALWRGEIVSVSRVFSVAAIPQNWSVSSPQEIIDGSKRGMLVKNRWESDSGNTGDLDQVQRKEVVERKAATGNQLTDASGHSSSGWKAATKGRIKDRHTLPGSDIARGEGKKTTHQGFQFRDARTGVTNIPANNCGFEIIKDVRGTPGNSVKVTKQGKDVNVNGTGYGAGAGGASKTVAV